MLIGQYSGLYFGKHSDIVDVNFEIFPIFSRTTSERGVEEVSRELMHQKRPTRDVISLEAPAATTSANTVRPPTKQPAAMDTDSNDVESCNDFKTSNSESGHKTLQDRGSEGIICERLKCRYDESLELASYGRPLYHKGGAKLLSIDDSVELLRQHTKKIEVGLSCILLRY